MENQVLDTLARETGEIVENPQTIEDITDSKAERLAEEASRKLNNYVYDTGSPTPGEPIDKEIDRILDINPDDATEQLIREAAIMKAQNEKEAHVKTKEEKAAEKERVCSYLLYQAEQDYYTRNHFVMDGRTKRRTKSKISREYDKGRYRPANGKTLND